MTKEARHTEMSLLLDIIDQAYDKKAWHGTNLRGSLRGLTVRQALWRPAPDRHNIWELVLHATYWKYAVRRRLRREKRGSFPTRGSNWFALPAHTNESSWRQTVAMLEETHLSMRQAIAELRPDRLYTTPRGSKISNATLIYGIASHDLYHAGQIQMLKRLQKP